MGTIWGQQSGGGCFCGEVSSQKGKAAQRDGLAFVAFLVALDLDFHSQRLGELEAERGFSG